MITIIQNTLNYLGACLRWLYGLIWRMLAGKKKFAFKEYLNGAENPENEFDATTTHRFVNILLGFIVLGLAIILFLKKCS